MGLQALRWEGADAGLHSPGVPLPWSWFSLAQAPWPLRLSSCLAWSWPGLALMELAWPYPSSLVAVTSTGVLSQSAALWGGEVMGEGMRNSPPAVRTEALN